MLDHHALGPAGRPGGVDHVGRAGHGRRPWPGRRRPGRADQLAAIAGIVQRRPADARPAGPARPAPWRQHGDRGGVGEHERDPVRRVGRIDGARRPRRPSAPPAPRPPSPPTAASRPRPAAPDPRPARSVPGQPVRRARSARRRSAGSPSQITAVASGVRAACAANSSGTVPRRHVPARRRSTAPAAGRARRR